MNWVSVAKLDVSRKDRRVPWILAAICAAAFVVALWATRSENPLRPDSASYLFFDPSRSIGYPIFLWVVRQFTGQALLAVPIQMLLLAATLFLLGLSFDRYARRPLLSVAFQLLLICNPELWKSSAGLITEALATSIVALWCAQLLRLLNRSSLSGITLLAILSGVGTLVRPSLIPLFAGAAILALLLDSKRSRWQGLAITAAGFLATVAATPVANYLIHGSPETGSPVARGLLQHSLFCAPSAPPGDADAAFVETQAVRVRNHVQKAPSGIQPTMRQLYSGELRFGLIIPHLGRVHGLQSGWQTDPIILRIARERILSNPQCYSHSVLRSYYRMATFDTAGSGRVSRLRNFLAEHPPIPVPFVPLLAGDDSLARRAAIEVGAAQPALPGQPSLEPPKARPILLLIGARLFLTTAAVTGLLALLFFAVRPRIALDRRRVIVGMAALGAVFHGVLAVTALVEFALSRYTVPIWPVTSMLLGLLAMLMLDAFLGHHWRSSAAPA